MRRRVDPTRRGSRTKLHPQDEKVTLPQPGYTLRVSNQAIASNAIGKGGTQF